MAVPFDHIASTHDSVFTSSPIGQLQRKTVWRYVERIMPELKGFEMLELNCGTGEDAVLFGDRGFNIVATDISSEMLKVTHKNSEQFSLQSRISSHYLDLDSFDETLFDKKFDLIFSNFGGLNCINPESLRALLKKLPTILNPGGRFVGVVMPKFCAWETIFFLLRLQFKKAFRRSTNSGVISDLRGTSTKMWYYNPSEIKKWTEGAFRTRSVHPLGFVLPSSYLETFITLHKRALLRLNKIEKKFDSTSLLAGMADNFIIDLQLKA